MDFVRGLWRFIQPFRHYAFRYPVEVWRSYFHFISDWSAFNRAGGKLKFRDIAPILYFKKEDVQTGGGHYFYQDIWALRHLSKIRAHMHYDVGSRFDGFTGQATAFGPITCVDIRPPAFRLPDFHFTQGSILQLPMETDSLDSISCLHTIEHIGLGRYGDEINPNGFELALSELQRVLKSGGHLILSMPVGRNRIEFNAQRVLDPSHCIQKLDKMELIEFSIVNDQDEFIANVNPAAYSNANYCCGLYFFRKK